MSAFEDLAESCEASIKKLNACGARLGADADAAAAKAANNDATRFVRDAQGYVTKMEAEAKVAAPSARRELVERIAQLKAALQAARSTVQKANDAKERASLLKPADKAKAIDAAAQDKLESAAKKSTTSTAKLQQAQQVLAETQDLGVKCVRRGRRGAARGGWAARLHRPAARSRRPLFPSRPRPPRAA